MMHILDVVTILCATVMTGNELAVSLFVNPALWQLEDRAQATALRILARVLGKTMPVWYIASLILMFAEIYLRRHEPALVWLVIAAGLWAAIIVFTVTLLVPINNRMSALSPDALPLGWHEQHRKWDAFHRLRILFLVIAVVSLMWGILESN